MLRGILKPVASLFGIIMNGIYNFLSLFGIYNIGLSIIIFTFITKTLMLPINLKQQKFTRISSRMTPELQKIQEKYRGKTDEKSMAKFREEQQGVYRKYGVSQSSGCLPMLITIPILMSLYGVINNVPAHVTKVAVPYDQAAYAIMENEDILPISDVSDEIINMISDQNNADEDVINEYTEIIKKYEATIASGENQDIEGVVASLATYNRTDWKNLINLLENKSTLLSNMSTEEIQELDLDIDNNDIRLLKSSLDTVIENEVEVANVSGFLGFSINDAPGWRFPGIIIPLLAMSLQFLQTRQISGRRKEEEGNKNDATAGAASSMNVIMPIFSGFICMTLPIGIGIYWISTSVFTIIQQFILNRYLDKVGLDTLIERSAEKAAKKNKYVTGAGNNSGEDSFKKIATYNTKSIETVKEKDEIVEKESETKDSNDKVSDNPTSIKEIANLLKDSSYDKGAKK